MLSAIAATSERSPLASNDVYDISCNGKSIEVPYDDSGHTSGLVGHHWNIDLPGLEHIKFGADELVNYLIRFFGL